MDFPHDLHYKFDLTNDDSSVRDCVNRGGKRRLLRDACGAALIILGISSLPGCETPWPYIGHEPITTFFYMPRDHVHASTDKLSADEQAVVEKVAQKIQDGHTVEAIKAIEAARQDAPLDQGDPYSIELIYLKGIAIAEESGIMFGDQQRTKQAIALFDKVIEAAPDDSRAYFHRWQLRLATDDRAGAAADRETGKRLGNPEFDTDYSPSGGVI